MELAPEETGPLGDPHLFSRVMPKFESCSVYVEGLPDNEFSSIQKLEIGLFHMQYFPSKQNETYLPSR